MCSLEVGFGLLTKLRNAALRVLVGEHVVNHKRGEPAAAGECYRLRKTA